MISLNTPLTPSENDTQEITWENLISDEQWGVYRRVTELAREHGVGFALGGALAVGCFTGRLSRSKDLDMYVLPEHRDLMVSITESCGLTDYFDVLPYDRKWIYRSHDNGVIVDAIWAMANGRARVDPRWIEAGPCVQLFGQTFKVIPPEELIWSKLYVLQRDRCDWPDILNLIYATGPALDWSHLLERAADDAPLVSAVLSIFGWMCPGRARQIPRNVWRRLGLPLPKSDPRPSAVRSRKDLLDSRPWLLAEPLCSTAA